VNTPQIGAVLLDIEGTTTPIAFVYDVLFPFARAHLTEYLRRTWKTAVTRDAVQRLWEEHAADVARGEAPPPWPSADDGEGGMAAVDAYARWLMDRDRKSPGLKLLQGHLWEQGYRSGALRGEVFRDVVPFIRRCHAAGRLVGIYSSGSVLAQRLLFESTSDGDVTPLISFFFDTGVGPKTSADSYRQIASALALSPARVLFVSDAEPELEAARAAGMAVLLSSRPGNAPPRDAGAFAAIRTFDEISLGTPRG